MFEVDPLALTSLSVHPSYHVHNGDKLRQKWNITDNRYAYKAVGLKSQLKNSLCSEEGIDGDHHIDGDSYCISRPDTAGSESSCESFAVSRKMLWIVDGEEAPSSDESSSEEDPEFDNTFDDSFLSNTERKYLGCFFAFLF